MRRVAFAVASVFLLVASVAFSGEKEPDAKNNVPTVPPPGIAPFDPKPLMDKLKEQIKTDKFRFVALGDAKHAKTLPVFLKYLDDEVKPDFILTTGDMVSSGG